LLFTKLVVVSVYAGRPGDLRCPKEYLEELEEGSWMKAKEILKHLDEHMGIELTLVNPNHQLADTRMTVFRSEKLVGTVKEIFEGVEIYAYGNCIEQQGFIETRSLFFIPEDVPLEEGYGSETEVASQLSSKEINMTSNL